MSTSTQEHLAIREIQNDILILKNGGGALVLEVPAVNFGLLSYREQMAIITSFAQMLNSLSFSIQIVIMSEKLNISSYLTLLSKAQKAQTNSMLSEMITKYKAFIQSVVKENEVLDKKFYMVVPLFAIELGLTASKENLEQKIKTVLLPRKDQVVRQLARVGLQGRQLGKEELVRLFYDIYNGAVLEEKPGVQAINPQDLSVKLKNPVIRTSTPGESEPTPGVPSPFPSPASTSFGITQDRSLSTSPPLTTQSARTHPFIVEELPE